MKEAKQMLDTKKIPKKVLGDIRMAMGASEAADASHDQRIAELSATDAFEKYLAWNGLGIGWTGQLIAALDGLRGAQR